MIKIQAGEQARLFWHLQSSDIKYLYYEILSILLNRKGDNYNIIVYMEIKMKVVM